MLGGLNQKLFCLDQPHALSFRHPSPGAVHVSEDTVLEVSSPVLPRSCVHHSARVCKAVPRQRGAHPLCPGRAEPTEPGVNHGTRRVWLTYTAAVESNDT